MFDKEVLDSLGTLEREEHILLDVDAVGAHVCFHQEGYLGMVEEHSHIVHQHSVAAAGDKGGLAVLEVDVLYRECRAALGTLHVVEHDGVAQHQFLRVELAVHREVAVALGIEGIAEAGHKLDFAATVVLILHDGALAFGATLLEYHQVDVDIALGLAVVEEHQGLVSVGMHADGDGVTLTAGTAVVKHNVVLLAHVHGNGLYEATQLLLG